MSGIESVRDLLNSVLKEINYNGAKIEIKPVSSGGANYTSELYVITVTHENKETLHLFAKVAIMSEKFREEFKQSVFELEDKVYRKLATAYEEIQEKHGIPKDERYIFSKFYGSSLEVGKEIFIFENLNLKGYQIYDRFTPLDYQSLFDTTTALAKYHALGIALKKERPEIYEEFESGEMMTNFDGYVESLRPQIDNHFKSLDKQYHSVLRKFLEDDGYEKYKHFLKLKGQFLIHWDFKSSNILHKKENGKVTVVPVDYQGVHVGSPVTDLLYFITTGTDENFLVNHFEELVEHYYKQLSLYSSRLGVDLNDVYPERVFQGELKKMLPGTVVLALWLFPLILVEADDAPVVSNDNMELKSLFIKLNPRSTERLVGYIKTCERWGIL